MQKIRIRGIDFTPEPYTDRDLMRLGAIGDPHVDEEIAERNASKVLRRLFPSMPNDWTRGDRVSLHTAEIGRIMEVLSQGLLQDKTFTKSLPPGAIAQIKALPQVFDDEEEEGDYEDDDEGEDEDLAPVAPRAGFKKASKNRYR